MEINVFNKEKIVEIWLTTEEKQDKHLQTTLKTIFSSYKSKKYTVAVFISGEQNLLTNTISLLLNNRAGCIDY